MKLRITPDLVRFRLEDGEVERLLRDRHLVQRLSVSREHPFEYGIVIDDSRNSCSLESGGDRSSGLVVVLPGTMIDGLMNEPDESIRLEATSDTDPINIVIEADQACRHG
ncbi:MAG: hypothetical protein CMJ32_03490 [Phycisphaerae bacterium]|nr:hypothetical protein [Phycisphaerae bacterium]